ncbi:hypothetical protein BpHYR1_006278 [Brachionus plicatilis]|uniref:Uncharacterized protein n=1 Tax=Brachionus plicatilis TaxID=10195 RepID=A0A3M7RBQ8_BRAPC|nr:hypothetical protein BpHYR1_006278 [Brachionus plicatilis]
MSLAVKPRLKWRGAFSALKSFTDDCLDTLLELEGRMTLSMEKLREGLGSMACCELLRNRLKDTVSYEASCT